MEALMRSGVGGAGHDVRSRPESPDMEPRFLIDWLPPDISDEAAEEPVRFQALCKVVQSAASLPSPQMEGALRAYIPILNNFLDTKQLFPATDVIPLVQAMYGVVCKSTHDLEVQVRTAECLAKVLQLHKRVLGKYMHADNGQYGAAQGSVSASSATEPPLEAPVMVLPWRPLFDTLTQLYCDPPPALEGFGLTSTRLSTLTFLVTRCRRYFDANAVVELWELLRPAVLSVTHTSAEAFQALGWFALFAPTNQINRLAPGVPNQLLSEWVSAWRLLALCPSWDAVGVGLLARLAKHDWKGFLDWQPYLALLFTHMLNSFELPVGSAANAPYTTRPAPARVQLLFGSLVRNQSQHTARLAVHLLREVPQRPHTAARAADVMQRLRQLAALVDNYLHPSNTGRWCKGLGSWLGQLVSEFAMQVGKQGRDPAPWSAYLPTPTLDAFVGLACPLAARAQFSKDEGLSHEAVTCLSTLAYMRPAQVLPMVIGRFRSVLENSNATQQLCAAITCLARCVRPLLLSGWGMEEETGTQVLAEALVALLPGIDANDEAKTLAVIHFYVSVLSSAPYLGSTFELDEENVPEGAVTIPVFVEEWADDLVTRLCTLLSNLDTGPGHRGTDAASGQQGAAGGAAHAGNDSFLLGSSSLFSQLIELLVSRLPRSVSASVARRLTGFAAAETLPGVQSALSSVLAETAQHHPQVVINEFVRPTLESITRDLAGSGGLQGMHEISSALEGTLCHKLNLLYAVLWHMPGGLSRTLIDPVERTLDAAYKVSSRQIHDAASHVLASLCHSLITPELVLPPRRLAPLGPQGALLVDWVDRTGTGCDGMRWVPPPEDGHALVQKLIDKHLLQPAQRLAATAAGGEGGSSGTNAARMAKHADIVQVKGMLTGLLSDLDDFHIGAQPANAASPEAAAVAGAVAASGAAAATPLYVAGRASDVVGAGKRIRETLAQQLLVLGQALAGQHDVESLSEFLVVCEFVLAVGSVNYSEAKAAESRCAARMAMLHEPAAAGALLATHGVGSDTTQGTGRPWRKRIPVLIAATQMLNKWQWRISQRAFRGWATLGQPEITHVSQLSPEYRALVEFVSSMTTHSLRRIRSEALTVFSSAIKRYPAMACYTLPHTLSAIADLPAPPDLTLTAAPTAAGADASAALAAYDAQLLAAALRDVAPPADLAAIVAAAAPPPPPAEEPQGARDGRVDGAVQAVCQNLPYWRLVGRDVRWYKRLMLAALASRAHNSTVAQNSLSGLFVQLVSRHVKPPGMEYGSEEFTQLASVKLHLAKPETLSTSFRYCLTANVMSLVLTPPPSAGPVCLPFLRHALATIKPGCMLQLGRLAMSSLGSQLTRLIEYGEANQQMGAEVSAWLAQPGTGAALYSLMSADHATLESAEAGQDARGGALAALQAKLLNMNHEDFLLKVLSASTDARVRWPEGGVTEWAPAGISQGLFIVPHAHLVRMLATIAPTAAADALRAPLATAADAAAAQRVVTTSDKSDQAAAAEITAGLIGAGLPYVAGNGADAGGWLVDGCKRQLLNCTLELSEGWAVCVRYGLASLLAMHHPPFRLARHLNIRPDPQSPLPAQAASSATAAVLELVASAGPPPASIAHVAAAMGAATQNSATAGAIAGGQIAVTKRLRYTYQCMRELLHCLPDATTPEAVLSYWLKMAIELRQVLDIDVLSLRQQLGKMIGALIMHVCPAGPKPSSPVDAGMDVDIEVVERPPSVHTLDDGPSPIPTDTPCDLSTVKQAVKRLEETVAAAFAAGCEAVQALKRSSTGGGSAGPTSARTAGEGQGEAAGNNGGGSNGSNGHTTDTDRGSDIVMVDRPLSPTPLQDDESFRSTPLHMTPPDTPMGGAGTPHLLASATPYVSVSRVGVVLSLLSWSSLHGQLAVMQPMLYNMLPQVFRLQELAGPLLQKLSHEALLALALAKYWPTPTDPALQTQVLNALSAAMSDSSNGPSHTSGNAPNDLWSERAAALSFAQTWWFRACFMLPQQHIHTLTQLVQARLADSKPEVRTMAGATLSGMLRGMDPTEATALRTQLVTRAQQLLAPRKRTAAQADTAATAGSTAGSAAQTLLDKHAVIQGLTAFLQSTPYDCPPWLPPVLLALVRPATAQHGFGLEAALRTAASKALSEFKRTHEQDTLQELKRMMGEDEWDSLQQATSNASYFS